MPKKIKSVEDVKGIVGLGTKMAKKIKEILQTGKLRKAEKMQVIIVLFPHPHSLSRMMKKSKF